jgi:hypothetical protein
MLPPGALSLGACGGAFFPPRRPSRRAVRPRASGDAAPPEARPARARRRAVPCSTPRASIGASGAARRAAQQLCHALHRCSGTEAAPQPAGEAANKWHDNVLEGAKRLSAEHLPPLREAAQRVVSQAAERVPHSAKAVELGAGLWARLPEPAQKAAPPVAGALGVRALARGTPHSAAFIQKPGDACVPPRALRPALTLAPQVLLLGAMIRGSGANNPALFKARA